MGRTPFVAEVLAVSILALATLEAPPVHGQRIETVFVALRTCRVVDSRIGLGTTGPLAPGAVHTVLLHFQCGVPI